MLTSPPSLVFFGTPRIAAETLDFLIREGFPVLAAVTRPDGAVGRGMKLRPSAVKEAAWEKGVPVLTPKSLRKGDGFQALRNFGADFFVVVAYGRILPADFLRLPKRACLNVHYSLLPRWRGAAPIEYALLEGDAETGVSVIEMNERMDEGKILSVRRQPIEENDDRDTLSKKLCELGKSAVAEALSRFDALRPEPQNDALATHAPPVLPADARIDWREPAEKIFNRCRAFSPKPGLKTLFRRKPFVLWKLKIADESETENVVTAGELIVGENRLRVQTGKGIVEIEILQCAGKKKTEAKDFINGYRPRAGERFESLEDRSA